MKIINVLFFLVLILVACESEIEHQPEMSQWRGPDRNGVYPEKNLLDSWPEEGPEIVWQYDGIGTGYSSVAAVNDKVIIAGTIDSMSYLFAFDHEGELRWKTELGPEWTKTFPGIRSTPLIYDTTGYVINGLGVLFAFNTNTGDIEWQKDILAEFEASNIQHGINENLLMDGDKLFCTPGGEQSNIIALNRHTGDVIWVSEGTGEKSAYCSPLLIDHKGKKFLITMTFKTLVSIDAENGKVIWKRNLEGDMYGIHAQTPQYRDGFLFVQDGYEIGCFMLKLSEDGSSYEEIWKNRILDETNGHTVVLGNKIFGAAETKKKFVCLDWNSGELIYDTEEISEGTVISADGKLFCCTYNGVMSLVIPGDTAFSIKSQFELPGDGKYHIAHPVIYNGRLYVRNAGLLTVYNIAKNKDSI